jgi:integrase
MSDAVRGQPMNDLKGFLPESQVRKLIEGAMRFRDKVFLRLLWVTGARVSEILGDKTKYPVSKEISQTRVFEPARVSDIDFEEGVIILQLLKRRAYPPPRHRVPLDQVTLQNLRDYILQEKLQPNQPIFKFTRQRALQIIREAGESVGIKVVGKKKLHNHHMRHSHCIAYVRHNNTLEGLRKLQQRIGHANINTTAGYLQFGPEEKKETEDIFGQW